jgi:hypothetical protein
VSSVDHLRTARRELPPGRRPYAGGRPLPLWYSLLLSAVLVAATSYGLLVEGAYPAPAGVRPTLPETLRGQDLVTLLAAGALVWGAVRARAGSLAGHIVWLAVCVYVPYTYFMYVVAPYNDALLLYIAAIGLGTYGLFDGLVRLEATALDRAFASVPRRGAGAFLVAVGLLFAALWLVDILSVWPGGRPQGLFVYDLPSIVHVLDLALMLPFAVTTGILLLRDHPIAPVLAAVVFVHTLTLGLALLSMNAFVAAAGATANTGEVIMWTVMVLVSLTWLTIGARRLRTAPEPWLRPNVW